MLELSRYEVIALIAAIAIIYVAFFIGWVFRDHLGIPRSQLKGNWVALVVGPVTLTLAMLFFANAPRWAHFVVIMLLAGVLLPRLEARMRAAKLADPLVGRECVVVRGHPESLQVTIDGELWSARPEFEGLILFPGERAVVRGRDGVRLAVGK